MLRDIQVEVEVVAEPRVDPVLALLRNARDRVKKGWIQGRMCDQYGRVCALGAILVAEDQPIRVGAHLGTPRSRAGHQAVYALARVMGTRGYNCTKDVMAFNDNHTRDVVLAKFDQAIEGRKHAARG